MNKPTLFSILVIFGLISCEVKPSEINYGTDSCHFCKMTIVDQSYAAQIVTTKGRAYKYDAIECMVQSMPQWQSSDLQYLLVTDITTPKKLIDATKAYYLISDALPSPMGANLSGFQREQDRNQYLLGNSDRGLNWQELKEIQF